MGGSTRSVPPTPARLARPSPSVSDTVQHVHGARCTCTVHFASRRVVHVHLARAVHVHLADHCAPRRYNPFVSLHRFFAPALHPIVTKRTEATVAAIVKGARMDRWRRVALASVKQSRRATLPEIRGPLAFEDFLAEPPAAMRVILVEPAAAAGAASIGTLRD